MFGTKMFFPSFMISMEFPEGVKLVHIRMTSHVRRAKDLHVLSSPGDSNRNWRLAQRLGGYCTWLGVRVADLLGRNPRDETGLRSKHDDFGFTLQTRFASCVLRFATRVLRLKSKQERITPKQTYRVRRTCSSGVAAICTRLPLGLSSLLNRRPVWKCS